MFKPERKSHWYLLLVIGVASLIGWSIFTQYKPMIIQTSCSEIASRSSNLLDSEEDNGGWNTYSYYQVRSKCIQESDKK